MWLKWGRREKEVATQEKIGITFIKALKQVFNVHQYNKCYGSSNTIAINNVLYGKTLQNFWSNFLGHPYFSKEYLIFFDNTGYISQWRRIEK